MLVPGDAKFCLKFESIEEPFLVAPKTSKLPPDTISEPVIDALPKYEPSHSPALAACEAVPSNEPVNEVAVTELMLVFLL